MSSHKKISILGSGRVGSSIAYSLILEGLCSEIVLVDIAKELAQGESYAPDAIYIIVSNRSMSLHMQYRRLQDCQKSVSLEPELSDSEKGLLIDSANILKDVIQTIEI